MCHCIHPMLFYPSELILVNIFVMIENFLGDSSPYYYTVYTKLLRLNIHVITVNLFRALYQQAN